MSESIWDDPRITAYVLGEMPADELAEFEQMLESDPQLAEAVDEARGVTHQLESLYAAEPVQSLDADRRQSLTEESDAKLTTATQPATEIATSAPGTRGWKVPLMVLATAAALLLLIGGPQWWAGDRQVGQVDESAPPPRVMHNSADLATDSESESNQEGLRLPAIGSVEIATTEERMDGDAAIAANGAEPLAGSSRREAIRSAVAPMPGQLGEGEEASAAPGTNQLLKQQATDSYATSELQRQAGQKGRSLQRAAPSRAADKLAEAPAMDAEIVEGNTRPAPGRNRAAGREALSAAMPAPGAGSGAMGGGGRAEAEDDSNLSGAVPESERGTSALSVSPRPSAPVLSKDPTIRSQRSASRSLAAGQPVEFKSESGVNAVEVERAGDVIVLRGNKEDVARVQEQIAQIQAQSNARVDALPESQQADGIAMGTVPPAPASPAPAGNAPASHAPGSDSPAAAPTPFAGTPIGQPATALEAKLTESYRSKNLSTVDLSKSSRFTRGGQAAVNAPRPELLLRRGRAITPGLQGLTPNYGLLIDEGRGPGIAGDRFDPITDNAFKRVSEHPLSTFSVDVDTASYSKTRDYLVRQNSLPRPDAVRIEELVNYFDYEYVPPKNDAEHPFATTATLMSCPWNEEHRLARIALKGKTMQKEERPRCNLVFLLDTSGSMNAANKLPLVIEGMKMLIGELDQKDKVAITVYAGSAGLVLDSTSAKKSKKIRKALTELSAGGSTNGGAGIALAYQTARDNFIADGVNRVILCTDGDFNVGTTGTDELVRMVEKEAKGGIFLSVLGFGMGNHNDAMLEQISGRGNGNYAFIDTREEARKVLVDQTSGTLVTIAKDVKLQIEFNPNQISSYRLIGYENRVLAKEDFKNDKVDAGEIGAGHTVTALYEIVPAGVEADAASPEVDDLKYQQKPKPTKAADSGESMTLKLRYKQPDRDESTEIEIPVKDNELEFQDADHDARFAAAVAGFGMQLRRSKYAGSWTLDDVIRVAKDATGEDEYGIRAEFISLAERAKSLMGQE